MHNKAPCPGAWLFIYALWKTQNKNPPGKRMGE